MANHRNEAKMMGKVDKNWAMKRLAQLQGATQPEEDSWKHLVRHAAALGGETNAQWKNELKQLLFELGFTVKRGTLLAQDQMQQLINDVTNFRAERSHGLDKQPYNLRTKGLPRR